jgi:phage-related protein
MSDTFTPPVTPSVGGVRIATTPRVIETKLGDGYSQRAADGLNALARAVSLRWDTLSRADADSIVAFFEAHGGAEHWLYAVPPGGTTRKWVLRSWDRSPTTALTDSISCEIVEVFDL